MLGHPGGDLRMCGLDHQGADAADEGGDVPEDRPGDRLGAEQAGVASVGEGVLERVVGVREEVGGGGDHPVAIAVDGGSKAFHVNSRIAHPQYGLGPVGDGWSWSRCPPLW